MVREGVILGEESGVDDPRTRAFVGKAVQACPGTVSFSHCCHSHCCRTFFAPMSHRTAGIRTFGIRTRVSFALLTLSHCWHSHCWLRTGVVRTFVFRTLVVQARGVRSAVFGTSTSSASGCHNHSNSLPMYVAPARRWSQVELCCAFAAFFDVPLRS